MKLTEIPARAAMWADARRTRIDPAKVVSEPPAGASDTLLLRALEAQDAPERTPGMLALRAELRKTAL